MKIQKYKAKIKGTGEEVIGYITEQREYIGNGSYGDGIDYLISVNEISMKGGGMVAIWWRKESIKLF